MKNPRSSFFLAWCSLTMVSELMSLGSVIFLGYGSPALSSSQ